MIMSRNLGLVFGLYYKCFTIVTCDYNDSSLYYKTMFLHKAKVILSNLALARSINCDRKVCCKMKHILKLQFTVVKLLYYRPLLFSFQCGAILIKAFSMIMSRNLGSICGLYYKCFTIITYDYNDSSLY
jgi:hypothetical protein